MVGRPAPKGEEDGGERESQGDSSLSGDPEAGLDLLNLMTHEIMTLVAITSPMLD